MLPGGDAYESCKDAVLSPEASSALGVQVPGPGAYFMK